MTTEPSDGDRQIEFTRRFDLTVALSALPGAELIDPKLPVFNHGDLLDWLEQVIDWVNRYQALALTRVRTTQEMSAALNELRAQRAAIRSFLGITQGVS